MSEQASTIDDSIVTDISEENREQTDQLYKDNYRTFSRHFTKAGRQRADQLIADIRSGKNEAVTSLIQFIQPWIERTRVRIASQVFVEEKMDEQELLDAATDALLSVIHILQTRDMEDWYAFTVCIQRYVRHQYETMLLNSKKHATVSLDRHVPNIHRQRSSKDDDEQELLAENEPAEVPLHEMLPSSDSEERLVFDIDAPKMRKRVEWVLQTLTYREREIVKLRYGFGGEVYTFDEIARIFEVTRARVRQIEARAWKKLRNPIRARLLEEFVEPRALPIVEKLEREKQKLKNDRILKELGYTQYS